MKLSILLLLALRSCPASAEEQWSSGTPGDATCITAPSNGLYYDNDDIPVATWLVDNPTGLMCSSSWTYGSGTADDAIVLDSETADTFNANCAGQMLSGCQNCDGDPAPWCEAINDDGDWLGWCYCESAPSSSPTTLPDDGATAGNVCVPDSGCNVCDACCASYLSDQDACDGCVADECAVANVCVPDAGCNVCDACCASYLSGQDACDGCVEEDCVINTSGAVQIVPGMCAAMVIIITSAALATM